MQSFGNILHVLPDILNREKAYLDSGLGEQGVVCL